MSRVGLARLWAVLGSLLALYATGTWITLQGGKSFADIPGLEVKSPVTSAYLAVLVVGALLGVLSAVGLFFIRTERADGDALLPIVAVADLGPHRMSSSSMALYQAFFLSVFLLLPAASLFELNSVVLQRGVLWHDGDPALGSIVVKNAFNLIAETSDIDRRESACAPRVVRDEGFTWLANMRCDLVKDSRLRPFYKEGRSITDDANAAAAQTCTRDLALAQSQSQSCEGVRDISEECETSERHCRGIQWLPVISPLLLIIATLFGWTMLAWLLVEVSLRKIATWRRSAGGAVSRSA